MEIIIKIEADNAAFDPVYFNDTIESLLKNAARELSVFMQPVPSMIDGKIMESIVITDNRFAGMRASLIDPNGNTCGYVEMIR